VRSDHDKNYLGIMSSMAMRETAMVMMVAYEFCELEA
jgi:hypothetical protein